MEIILLEKVRNLGDIGARVKVKTGYARNYLVPYGKAVVANALNLAKFEKMHKELENKAEEVLRQAQDRAIKFTQEELVIPVKATEDGKLFGSVGASVIVQHFNTKGLAIKRNEVSLPKGVIRHLGVHEIVLLLHSDVTVKVNVKVTSIS